MRDIAQCGRSSFTVVYSLKCCERLIVFERLAYRSRALVATCVTIKAEQWNEERR